MVKLMNKLCPVTTLVFALKLFIVVSYAVQLDSTSINGAQSMDNNNFLHNNDPFPVDDRVKRETTLTGFKYDGDTATIGNEKANRQPKAAIVNNPSIELNNSSGLTRIRRSKQDLCQHLCTCDTEGTEKFVTVSCSFLMDKVGSPFSFKNSSILNFNLY